MIEQGCENQMNMDSDDDTLLYKAVRNDEGQYSISLAHRENPAGWADAGKAGSKAECLDYIEKVWIDITPWSVLRSLELNT